MDDRRPRLLVVLTSLRAEGTPRLAFDLAMAWRERGVDCELLVLFDKPDDLKSLFENAGVPVHRAEWPQSGWRRYFVLVSVVRQLIGNGRLSGIVCMPLGWHLFVSIAGRTRGVPTVAHAGNRPTPSNSRDWRRFLLLVQLARPFTRRIAACSDYVRDSVVTAFRLSPLEVTTIPNGTSVPVVDGRPRRSFGPTVTLLMVATLERHKDHRTLIRAMASLRGRARDFLLLLAGDGGLRGEIEQQVAELGLNDTVRVLGTRSDIKGLLAAADLFVFATTEREGQGIALIEAMAAGVPIVASDVGACREVLADGACGLLVPSNDPQALASGIERAVEDAGSTEARRLRALARVSAYYTSASSAAGYLRQLGLCE